MANVEHGNCPAILFNQGTSDIQVLDKRCTSFYLSNNIGSVISSHRIKQSIPRSINSVMVSVKYTRITQALTFKPPPVHFMFRRSQGILAKNDIVHQYSRSILGIIKIPVQFFWRIDGIVQATILPDKLVYDPIIAIPHLKFWRVGFLHIHDKRGVHDCFRILGKQSRRIPENIVLVHRLPIAIKPSRKITPFHGNWDSQIVNFSHIIGVGASNKHTIIKSYAENFLVTVFLEVRVFTRDVCPFSFALQIINIFIQATRKFTLFHGFGRQTFAPHFTRFILANSTNAFCIGQKVLVVIAMLDIVFGNTRKRTRYGIAFYLARNINHIFKIIPARNPSRNTTGNLTSYLAFVFRSLRRAPCYNAACNHDAANSPLVDRSRIRRSLPQNSSGKISIDIAQV